VIVSLAVELALVDGSAAGFDSGASYAVQTVNIPTETQHHSVLQERCTAADRDSVVALGVPSRSVDAQRR
jgi:hypothetical protein